MSISVCAVMIRSKASSSATRRPAAPLRLAAGCLLALLCIAGCQRNETSQTRTDAGQDEAATMSDANSGGGVIQEPDEQDPGTGTQAADSQDHVATNDGVAAVENANGDDATRDAESGGESKEDPNGDGPDGDGPNGDSGKTAAASQPEDALDPDEQLPPAERVLLLSPAGPLLVDLHVTIAGQPFRAAFDAALDHVLQLADSDGDAAVTWEELLTHPRFRDGQFGNPATTTYQARQDMTRLYDTIKNGRVDREEVARYLTSNQAGSRATSLDTSNSNRVLNREQSPIWECLDRDGDFVLSVEEIQQAAARLRQRDADDDEILRPAEFVAATLAGPMTAVRPRARFYGPDAGWLLHPRTPWQELHYGWEEMYGAADQSTADGLLFAASLVPQLDVDGDGVLGGYEMEMLLEVEPHIAVRIEMQPGGDSAAPTISLAALHLPLEQIHGVLQHQSNRITILLPNLVLDLFAEDRLAGAGYEDQAQALLRQGDADKNEYLSEDEFAAVAGQLNVAWEAVDADENGQVVLDELATVLGQRQLIQRAQLRFRADDQSDALLVALDVNHDGRLDGREVAQVARQLDSLDANGDGRVDVRELPGSMVVGVVRGANPTESGFPTPSVTRPPSDSAPRWFLGMDRNGDGGISRREFLGSGPQFDQLDADDDDFIDAAEAEPR